MKKLQTLAIALVAVLTLTAAAEASVDLWTSLLHIDAGHALECRPTNVTSLARTVRVRIYSLNGTVDVDSGLLMLPPFSGTAVSNFPHIGYFSCRFTVPSRAYVRALGALFAIPGNSTDLVEIPAQ